MHKVPFKTWYEKFFITPSDVGLSLPLQNTDKPASRFVNKTVNQPLAFHVKRLSSTDWKIVKPSKCGRNDIMMPKHHCSDIPLKKTFSVLQTKSKTKRRFQNILKHSGTPTNNTDLMLQKGEKQKFVLQTSTRML